MTNPCIVPKATLRYVLARRDGPEEKVWEKLISVPYLNSVATLVGIERTAINAMADALMQQEQCDIIGFVLRKQVVAGNYVAVLPVDWVDALADDGNFFEIILLEKGYTRELRGISSTFALRCATNAFSRSLVRRVSDELDPKRTRSESCTVESSTASVISDNGDSFSNVLGPTSTGAKISGKDPRR